MSDQLRTDRYAIAMPEELIKNVGLVTWEKSEMIVSTRTQTVHKWEPTVPLLGQFGRLGLTIK